MFFDSSVSEKCSEDCLEELICLCLSKEVKNNIILYERVLA